jgi:hypothetical protein
MLFDLTQALPVTATMLHSGGVMQVQLSGTFGGATVNLSVSQDELTPFALTDFAQTSDNVLLVDMMQNSKYFFSLLNASGTTNIQVSIL